MNRFKLWFNKNGFKVISIIAIVLAIYYSIKGFNNFFKDMKEDRENERKAASTITQNNISTDSMSEGEINSNDEYNQTANSSNLIKIEHSAEEHDEVIKVAQKILNPFIE